MKQSKNGIGSIFTIESYEPENGNLSTFYFDLLSDLSFAVFKDEVQIMSSKNPNDCIEMLKRWNCTCSKNYNYQYLIK